MTQQERRKNARVKFKTTVNLQFNDHLYEQCAISNLSVKGLFAQGITDRNQGEKCKINLQLTGSSSELILTMTGVIVRTTPEGIGIHFEEINFDSFYHLKNIVYYNSEDPDSLTEDYVED